MRSLWRDTLFKRLFLLIWAALVLSHFAAYTVVTGWHGSPPGPARAGSPTPTFPSLPPTPGVPQVATQRHAGMPDRPPPPGMAPPGAPQGAPSLPWHLLALDYLVRLVLIGAAAWWGAGWLTRPMRRLVKASSLLGASIRHGESPPMLDASHGTVEVTDAAAVFNTMASELSVQFRTRGLLISAISHDLRTPLTRMRMRLERMEASEPVLKCIHDIRDMDQMIGSALDVFRNVSQQEAPQTTDVYQLLQSVVDDMVETGAAVRFTGEPVVAAVQPLALRRAVENLLQNAVRYGERASVTLRLGTEIDIWIDDHGPGIPEDQLASVFEPFYRLEPSRNRHLGGTGLGLYIARELVERQQGVLRLFNRREGGLRAVVSLPLSSLAAKNAP